MTNELTNAEYNNQDSMKDGYHLFEASLQKHFDKTVNTGAKLFTVDVEGLYELYLSKLPERKEGTRQHYTCHGCRHFLERYGRLVTIDAQGTMRSAIFDEGIVPEFFVDAVIAMRHAVLTSRVNGVFIPDARVLGTPKTGEWTHLHIRLPQEMVNRNVLRTGPQVAAQKREDFNILSRVVSQYTVAHVDQAIALLKSETVYRGDRYLPHAKWFKDLLLDLEANHTANTRRNYLWYASSEAPTGFIPSNSSNVGQLLKDLSEGASPTEAGRKLAERLDPRTFMRSQAAPTANKIREDEKIFAKLEEAGVASKESLQRRYAQIEEVPLDVWTPKEAKVVQTTEVGGVFGHLTPKGQNMTASEVNLPTKTMTWDKFQRTVLGDADKVEVLVDDANRFAALVTAVHADAPNILNWDNTFSWYYHGGADAEIRRRLEEFGASYEDNEIRASLAWEGLTDLDFHVHTPLGEHLMYNNKRGRCGGFLDLDMNGLDKKSTKPVENIRWKQNAPEGRYKFIVHNYSERVNGVRGTASVVELEINGKVYTRQIPALRNQHQFTAFEFDYKKGQDPVFVGGTPDSSEGWGGTVNKFVEVTGITTSPNLWGEKPRPQSGTHIFFLLKDVKDETEGKGRGFFNEMLIPELREIRKTLEAFTANAIIEGAEEATACGVGYSKEHPWNATLKVTTGGITQIVKIDRWD